jgi:glucan 1,3-beta-glucosidase
MPLSNKNTEKIKGVNLGGWLVFEKWITPSLFEGTDALDEFHLHKEQSEKKIEEHYQNFITEKDFEFLSNHGINSVRIPIGHWLFGDFPPFPKTIEYLDEAFQHAEKYNIKILIDLHTAPGSQNGYDHSGVVGEVNWHKYSENISKTLGVIEKISEKYAKHENLLGISLLNEPHKDIPAETLKDFYVEGYKKVRNHCKEDIAVVISDSFRPYEFSKIMQTPDFINVILDMHFYQCFFEENKNKKIEKIIQETKSGWGKLIKKVQRYKPIICGEWSLGVDPSTSKHLSPNKKEHMTKRFGETQLNVFNKTLGWFFWTYKTELGDDWDFRESVEKTILNL